MKPKNRNLIEPEEIFLDAEGLLDISASKKEREFLNDLEKTKIETPINARMVALIFLLIGTAFSVLYYGIFHLQFVQGNFFRQKSENNKSRAFPIQSLRGIIYDRERQQLVYNVAAFDLMVKPRELPADNAVLRREAEKLAVLLRADPDKLMVSLSPIRESGELAPKLFKGNIDLDAVVAIESDVEGFPGFEVEKRGVRSYAASISVPFSHILGYLGKVNQDELGSRQGYYSVDYIGKSGLELSYEDALRGESGKVNFEIDARQNVKKEITQLPESGKNIVLSIDADLTVAAEEILKRHLSSFGFKRGAVVIEDPRNGEILALCSVPDFNLDYFSRSLSQEEYDRLFNNPDKPMFNRAISGAYPIGSTIKPLIASAALQENIISPDKKIRAPAQIEIPNPYNPEKPSIYKDWRDHGWVAIRDAIAWSSNSYFYTIGGGRDDIEGLGIERIKKYAELFGLGNKTGIDLPAENAGFFPSSEWKKEVSKGDPRWRLGDTYNVSIGQGDVLATPLQVTNYISAIANGGTLYKPRIVRQVTDQGGSVIEETQPEILHSGFISAANLKVVKEGMRQTVASGSAHYLNGLPVEIAGKTGTAQYNNNTKSHAWFTGFAPYRDPQIVVTVLVEDGGEGSRTAVPIAGEIFEWYYWNRLAPGS